MELTYSNIIECIIIKFPKLIHDYKVEYEHAKTEHGILTYMFFGPIVREHFCKLATTYERESNEDVLNEIYKLADLFEDMATSNDIELENLLVIGLFEGMDPALYDSIRHIFRPKTIELLESRLMATIQSILELKRTGYLDIATYNAIMYFATAKANQEILDNEKAKSKIANPWWKFWL